MMCDMRMYRSQFVALNKRTLMYAPITDYDCISDLAKQIITNAPNEFHLVGLSMGGIVAMEIIRIARQKVKSVVLMDTNAKAEIPEVSQNRQPQILKVRQGKLYEVMRDEMKPNYLYDSDSKHNILSLCMEMAISLGDEVFIRQSIALKNRADQSDTLKNYDGKCLILQGEYDKLCPDDRHQWMHKLLKNSSYIKIKNAAHLPTLENPSQVNKILIDWFKNV